MHEPVGRVQFVVFEKIYKTASYLFQIVREKSCDYLLIIYMKKFEMVIKAEETHVYDAIRGKLRHPGRALDLKTKDLIDSDETLFFIYSQS